MKTRIIAEIGINHNGNINIGYKLIEEAKKAGVTSVKFQTYDPDLRFNKGNPFIETFRKFHLQFEE